MHRPSAILPVAAVLLLIGADSGLGTDPLPPEIPEMLTVTPDGAFGYTVRMYRYPCPTCPAEPAPGIQVELIFSPEAEALIAWADGQEHPVISGVTDQDR